MLFLAQSCLFLRTWLRHLGLSYAFLSQPVIEGAEEECKDTAIYPGFTEIMPVFHMISVSQEYLKHHSFSFNQ